MNSQNQKRELNGLKEAMAVYKLKKGIIITHNQDEIVEENNKTIILISAWRWLLEL